ncbi:MAG: luciferase family protein [Actinomycetota bacterium]
MEGALRAIEEAVLGWTGVTGHPHRFGGVEFRLGKVELGHLHGDRLADLPFPTKLRNELVQDGRARPHHVLPSSGWVSRPIRDASDVAEVIALFRLNYDRLRASKPRQSPDRERTE